MTREERLKFCSICKHQYMDMKRGIVCSLTNEYADFEIKCKNLKIDEDIISTPSQFSYFELHEVPWYKSTISLMIDGLLITFGIGLLAPLERIISSDGALILLALLWIEFYCFFFGSLWYKTPGMMIMRLRISMIDGSQPSLKRIVLRTICLPLNIIFIILKFRWTAHNGQIIWIHEKISKTYIVDPSNNLD